jgi:hypothetical protein
MPFHSVKRDVVHPVRYRPLTVGTWLVLGAQSLPEEDLLKARPGMARAVWSAVGKFVGEGKLTYAEIIRQHLEKMEYRLYEDRVETTQGARVKAFPYSDLKRCEIPRPYEFRFHSSQGMLVIRPYAWLSVRGLKVPLGWRRDRLEVPYVQLGEEIADRARLRIRR